MLARLRELRRKDSGFTLTELLIVIVILGVLAGIVVIAVSNFNDRGVQAACRTSVSTIEDAAELYHSQKSGYPGAFTETGDGDGDGDDDTYAALTPGDDSAAASVTRLAILVATGYLKDPVNPSGYTVTLHEDGQVTSDLDGCP